MASPTAASSPASSSAQSSPARSAPKKQRVEMTAEASTATTDASPALQPVATSSEPRIRRIRGDRAHWDVLRMLSGRTAFPSETSPVALGEFDASAAHETLEFLRKECQLLIIGAGGLGCELLKDAVLSGFGRVHIVDMDTIDVSNLNRQFLFRESDVGSPKAEVAARFVRERLASSVKDGQSDSDSDSDSFQVEITAHHKRVQDLDLDFYRQFHVILSGLDNIEARRYVNSLVVSLAELDADGQVDPTTIIPLIDGGTEGLRGQARVIIPRVTSCFECSLETFPPQKNFPMCTIAETPRQPAHCVAYALVVQWPRAFPETTLDKDSPTHMQWVYQQALERAEQFGIAGVTYSLTQGVVKNIIPAVASTNAVVAAMCVSEAWKALSYCSQLMNSYHMHMGATGCYSHTFEYQRKSDCVVCSSQTKTLDVDAACTTLQDVMDELCEPAGRFRLLRPSISSNAANLFMQGPPALRAATSANLARKMSELVADGQSLTVTDAAFAGDLALSLQICYKK